MAVGASKATPSPFNLSVVKQRGRGVRGHVHVRTHRGACNG